MQRAKKNPIFSIASFCPNVPFRFLSTKVVGVDQLLHKLLGGELKGVRVYLIRNPEVTPVGHIEKRIPTFPRSLARVGYMFGGLPLSRVPHNDGGGGRLNRNGNSL